MDSSVANFYQYLSTKGKDGETCLKDINKTLKLGEKYHFMMIIRAQAMAQQWDDIKEFIKMKKPPVTYSFLAEVCHEFGKVPFAVEAIKKISDYDEKITMLIDIGQWRDAIEESFNGKRLEYLDDIRAKGPSFVQDFIREE
jgi:ATP-dependent helicase/DNAse subunit B